MSHDEKNQWYTNKDLFELINQLQGEVRDFRGDNKELRLEMKETRRIIKQYNGLREEVGEARKEIDDVKEQMNVLQAKQDGRYSMMNAVRLWGGWLFALVTLLILLYKTFS